MGDEAQGHKSDSGKSDALDVKVVPIVFVPGVMGSRVQFDNAPNWDPDGAAFAQWLFLNQEVVAKVLNAGNKGEVDLRMADKALEQIKANTFVKGVPERSGEPPPDDPDVDPIQLFFEQRGWGSVVFSFYGELLIGLEESLNKDKGGVPYPVYALGYDWRQGNVDSGRALKRSVESILLNHPGAQKVVIITHSMGGLVTLSALKDGLGAKVAGVVHTVMPVSGAAVAYRRFHTGATLQFDGPPNAASFLDWIPAAGLNAVMGTDPEEYALTQSGLKGPLQLLPSNNYPDLFLNMRLDGLVVNNQEVDDIYEVYLSDEPPGIVPKRNDDGFLPPLTTISQTIVDRLRQNLRLARDFHNRISLIPTAHPETFVLVGDNVTTDVQFDWLQGAIMERKDLDKKVIKAPFGDGTVPAVSAEFRFASPAPQNRDPNINPRTLNTDSIFTAEHAGCFKNGALVAKVIENVRALIPNA